MPSPHPPDNPFISPLPRPVSTHLRSAVVIPTFPQVLSELVQNSLDAKASRIDCWVDLTPGGQSVRVEDDGEGIRRNDLGKVGKRFVSGKEMNADGLGPQGTFGFRGEALASIAALGLVEITSRTEDSRHTYTKIIKSSKTLFEGVSNRSISGGHGTAVLVKDLFHNIPVRQASLSSTSATSTLAACKRVIETLALAHPTVRWALWEERGVGTSLSTGAKKVLGLNGGKTSLDVFRSVYGNALVDRVQKIRVSSGDRRIDGFISVEGGFTKSHQHLYINHFPIDRGELHSLISKQFARSRFSSMTQESMLEIDQNSRKRSSPRHLERYPIYVLDISLLPSELDVGYDPKKGLIGYKDFDSLKAFLTAVADEFLKRNGFTRRRENEQDDHRPESPSRSRGSPSRPISALSFHQVSQKALRTPVSQRLQTLRSVNRPSLTTSASNSRTIEKTSPAFTCPRSVPIGPTKRLSTPVGGIMGGRRSKWIDDLISEIDTGVLPSSRSASPFTLPSKRRRSSLVNNNHHDNCAHSKQPGESDQISNRIPRESEVNFSADSLKSASVISQVDRKFICCIIASETSVPSRGRTRTLVLIDQHAADERISVERILRELCDGFKNDNLPAKDLSAPLEVILTATEVDQLKASTNNSILHRWGIHVDLEETFEPEKQNKVDYRQVSVTAVPALLESRLGRKDTTDLTRLIKLYLPVVLESHGEIDLLIQEANHGKDIDWGRILRWMPKEMLELANSKACRGAIMFGDRLDIEQCSRLVGQLSETRSPFTCAHGRPSLVPLYDLGPSGCAVTARRRVDWASYRLKSTLHLQRRVIS